jgi:hypothetical protein
MPKIVVRLKEAVRPKLVFAFPKHVLKEFWGGDRKRQRLHRGNLVLLCGVAVVIGAVFAGLASSVPGTAPLTASVLARSVAFDTSSQSPLVVGANLAFAIRPDKDKNDTARLLVGNYQSADPPIPGLQPGTSVIIQAATLRLTQITLRGSASFGMNLARGDELRILAEGGSLTIATTGTVKANADGSPSILNVPDGTITFRSAIGSHVPLRLEGRIAFPTLDEADKAAIPPLLIEDAAITTLRFGRENGTTSVAPFVSSIESGRLRLVKTDEVLTLERGSPLSLGDFDGTLISLDLRHDGAHAMFTGHAKTVALGPAGFSQDVTPSWFDVLYHITWIKVACAAFLTFVGALGTIFVFDSEKP